MISSRAFLVIALLLLWVVPAACIFGGGDARRTRQSGESTRRVSSYRFANAQQLSAAARGSEEILIVKGRANPAMLKKLKDMRPRVRVVNYEQAFALNAREAEYARNKGWLAQTCQGREISPRRIPEVTLLDGTVAAARDWRTDLIAAETIRNGYDFNYLDTLRAIFPKDFYDGLPCDRSDAEWLSASIATVGLVREKTGRPVIANGSGLQSGRNYSRYRPQGDRLIAAADAVQIEHFLRSPENREEDLALVRTINEAGKDVYAKCVAPPQSCRSTLADVEYERKNYLNVSR